MACGMEPEQCWRSERAVPGFSASSQGVSANSPRSPWCAAAFSCSGNSVHGCLVRSLGPERRLRHDHFALRGDLPRVWRSATRSARGNVDLSGSCRASHCVWQSLRAAAVLDGDTDQFEDDAHCKRNRPSPNGRGKQHQQAAEDNENGCNGAPDGSVSNHRFVRLRSSQAGIRTHFPFSRRPYPGRSSNLPCNATRMTIYPFMGHRY